MEAFVWHLFVWYAALAVVLHHWRDWQSQCDEDSCDQNSWAGLNISSEANWLTSSRENCHNRTAGGLKTMNGKCCFFATALDLVWSQPYCNTFKYLWKWQSTAWVIRCRYIFHRKRFIETWTQMGQNMSYLHPNSKANTKCSISKNLLMYMILPVIQKVYT